MPIAPAAAETWVFDLDNTLYPAECNLFAQVETRMRVFIQDLLDLAPVDARALQKRYWREHGTTMRGLMQEHGVDPGVFMDYVHDIDLSGVPRAERMARAFDALPGRKVIFTNGSVSHARRVLEHRGIDGYFEGIFDIVASDYRPKPDPVPYVTLCETYGIDPTRAVMVEDMARNLLPARDMGMATVWVPAPGTEREGADLGHVHHVTEDLESWLAQIAGIDSGPG